MAQLIKSVSGRWMFEIYNDKTCINSTETTAVLIAEPYAEGHNFPFPFKILGIYYVDNPKEYFLGTQFWRKILSFIFQ